VREIKTLLSIVIPTKNRYQYLISVLIYYATVFVPELELVIQDNSDNNEEILGVLKNYENINIKYYYNKASLSLIENSDLAINHSTGEYICFIGDDDGFTKSVLKVAKWMKKNKIHSCIGPKAIYYWPDIKFYHHHFPSLTINKFSGKAKSVKTKKELVRCLRRGATSLGKLPKVYHGIVSREILNKVYNETGSYFPGPCPDIANAVALCFYLDEHYYIDIPFVISGQSYKSAGGMGARHAHKSDINKVNSLPKKTESNWEREIPLIWTGQTIYAESCIKALRLLKKDEYINKFNFPYLYAAFICFHPKEFALVKDKFANATTVIKTMYYLVPIFAKRVWIYLRNFLSTRTGIFVNRKVYKNIPNIIRASEIADALISNENRIKVAEDIND